MLLIKQMMGIWRTKFQVLCQKEPSFSPPKITKLLAPSNLQDPSEDAPLAERQVSVLEKQLEVKKESLELKKRVVCSPFVSRVGIVANPW